MRGKHNFSRVSRVESPSVWHATYHTNNNNYKKKEKQTSHKPNEVKRLKRNMPPFSRAKHTYRHTHTPPTLTQAKGFSK